MSRTPFAKLSDVVPASKTVSLQKTGPLPEAVHVFEDAEILAIDAAVAAQRPLLVRGEPGTGKSQLARAAAKALKRAYVQLVVDSRTESRDLLWHFDAVARLADAQLGGAGRGLPELTEKARHVSNYLHPGPLWWAFHWDGAATQATRVGARPPPQHDGGDAKNGSVVLIDEIDKAESDVPNGLLEALGARQFRPLGSQEPVISTGVAPLVVITSNDERTLPAAFLRRCFVLRLALPESKDEFVACLTARGRKHFPSLEPDVLKVAAELLFADRANATKDAQSGIPGQAEYFDLLRALHGLAPDDLEKQKALMDEVSRYTFKKHATPVAR